MKIAMIGHKDFPSRSGGIEVVVYELATRLAARGHEVTVYNRGLKGETGKAEEQGVKIRRVPTFKKESLNAMVYSFVATFAALFHKYDVIHYHAIGPSVPIFVAHLFGKKTISTIHGLNWRCDKWNKFASAYLKLGERVAAKFADEVVVLSEEMKDYFSGTYKRNTVLIKNAISPIPQRECQIIHDRFGLERHGYILFIGRISPEKGIQDLVRAFKGAKTDKKLVIAGEMSDTPFVEEIRNEIGNSANIICTGFISGIVMEELYSNASLYVLPSHTEGLALTLLEGMSCGTRCLVSNIPENTSVLKDFGYSFAVSDIDSLIRALDAALSEPDENIYAEEQIKYTIENYGYENTVKLYERAYQSASNGRTLEEYIKKSTLESNFFVEARPLEGLVGSELVVGMDHELYGALVPESISKAVKRKKIEVKFDSKAFEKCCEWVENSTASKENATHVTYKFFEKTVSDKHFPDMIKAAFDKYGVEYSKIGIGIADFGMRRSRRRMLRNLKTLQDAGVRIISEESSVDSPSIYELRESGELAGQSK